MKIAILSQYPTIEFYQELGLTAAPKEHLYPWIHNLAQSLSSQNIEAHVITLRSTIKGDKEIKHSGGYYVHFICVKKNLSIISSLRKVVRFLKSNDFDVLHVQGNYLYAFIALLANRNRTVLTIHGIRQYETESSYLKYFSGLLTEAFFGSLARLIIGNYIVINPFVSEKLKIHGRIFKICNPISNEYFRVEKKTAGTKKIFLMLGSIIPRKNIEEVLSALAGSENVILRCVYASYDSEYMHWIKTLSETKNVIVEMEEGIDPGIVLHAFSEAYCLILSSKNETAPMVIAEAQAAKTPVIASDVGGVKYMIENGKNGLIYQMGNIQQLKERIEALNNISLYAEIQSRGYEYAQKYYNASSVAKQTIDVYKQIILS